MLRKFTGYTYATVLLTLFIVSVAASALLIGFVARSYQGQLVENLGRQEAQAASLQIFEHLYSVMRKGWTRQDVDDVLSRMRAVRPDMQIRVVRSAAVAEQYGEHAESSQLRVDPVISKALVDAETQYADQNGWIRYVMPLKSTVECQGCHTTAHAGGVNGVIDLRFPSDKLRAPLEATMSSTLALLALVGVGIFVVAFVFVRRGIADPITRMAEEMERIVMNSDYARRIPMAAHGPVELRKLAQAFNELLEDVSTSHAKLHESSIRDPLTGLYNRRYFQQAMDELQQGGHSRNGAFAVFLIDLDEFKPINDSYGHPAGDRMLEAVADSLRSVTGDADVVGRIGGDEFVVLIPAITEQLARQKIEGLRRAIMNTRVHWGDHELGVSASIGMSYCLGAVDDQRNLLAEADLAMYSDKMERKAGR